MKLIVLGCGRAGSYLADYLAEKGSEVTVVDPSPEVSRGFQKRLPITVIQGSGTDIDVLRRAGIEETEALIAVTDSDDANLMACLVAKRLYRVPMVVAGLRNPRKEETYRQFGVETVCALTVGAHRIIDVIMGK